MTLVIETMELEDISQVLEVDRESYTMPWPASAYRREILHNRNARYIVLRSVPEGESAVAHGMEQESRPRLPLPFFRWPRAGESATSRPGIIVGYAGMWIMVDEAHITTIAMRSTWRGQGLGELLLVSLVETAGSAGAERMTLEVRVSNEGAQTLYRKYGFEQTGLRRRYYSDNNEDAYIMTTSSIREDSYLSNFEQLVERLRARLDRNHRSQVLAPALGTSIHPEPNGT